MAGGKTNYLKLPGTIPIEGGLPLLVDGKIVGAIGVSGASSARTGVPPAPGPVWTRSPRSSRPGALRRGRGIDDLDPREAVEVGVPRVDSRDAVLAHEDRGVGVVD